MPKKVSKNRLIAQKFMSQLLQNKRLANALLSEFKRLESRQVLPKQIYTAQFSKLLASAKQEIELRPQSKELAEELKEYYTHFFCYPEKESFQFTV